MALASGARAKRARTGVADPPPALPGSSPPHLDRDWASLTSGPAGLIAESALSNDVADYIRFRAVCTAWRRAGSADPRAQGVADRRFHPRRWIMLPVAFAADTRRRRFLNVSTGQCIHVRVPDLVRRHYFVGRTAEGLLILCRKGTHVVQLLNPLTGQVTVLPRAATLLDPIQEEPGSTAGTASRLSRLSFHCAGLADDSTVALVVGRSTRTLAVAKPGDKRWTRLHLDDRIMTAFPFGGRLYCATLNNILVVETAASEQPRLAVVAGYDLEGGSCHLYHRLYMVKGDDGDLILVHRYPTDDGLHLYRAYRANLDTGNVVPASGLGGQALFVCIGRSHQSVPARVSSSISADTIYTCNHGHMDEPVVAFDVLGTRSELYFGEKDITSYLFSYVCSQI